MGAEIVDFRPGGLPPAGPKCRFCFRTLADPVTPDRMSPHCSAVGCRCCTECAAGQTSVSPLRSA